MEIALACIVFSITFISVISQLLQDKSEGESEKQKIEIKGTIELEEPIIKK